MVQKREDKITARELDRVLKEQAREREFQDLQHRFDLRGREIKDLWASLAEYKKQDARAKLFAKFIRDLLEIDA